MIRPNRMTPRTIGVMRPALAMIQPMLSDMAAETSSTQSATKNAIAFCRRVTGKIVVLIRAIRHGRELVLIRAVRDEREPALDAQERPFQREVRD